MRQQSDFICALTTAERRVVSRLSTPTQIQAFLDQLRYHPAEERVRCPLSVLRDGLAHCFEGAVFAAAALREIGARPLILNMFPEPDTDDEHLLAVYGRPGGWGAVAKSNYVGLRHREPVYRTVRELVMSYFESYYNGGGQKTLRSFTRPLDLAAFDRHGWTVRDETMNRISDHLDQLRRIPLLTESMIAGLNPMDDRSYRAGLLGSDPEGVYQP